MNINKKQIKHEMATFAIRVSMPHVFCMDPPFKNMFCGRVALQYTIANAV